MFIEIAKKKKKVRESSHNVAFLARGFGGVKPVMARRGEVFTSAARFAPSCPGRSGTEGRVGRGKGKERKDEGGGGVRGFHFTHCSTLAGYRTRPKAAARSHAFCSEAP